MTGQDPRIEKLTAAVYEIPTDQPEADGTLAWSKTTMVVAEAWDLKGKLLGLPVCRLLGAVRDEVPVYGSGGFTTYDSATARAQLELWADQWAIPRVKIKIGESWGRRPARDLQRIAFAREVIGPDVELYTDANGGYTRKQAVRMARAMAEAGVTWFEEPVSSDDLDGLREVREQVAADVAAGEYGYDLVYFERMAAARAVDCLQADVTRCGGITEWLRAAAVAAAHGLQVSGHCAPNLHAQVAAAVPNLRHRCRRRTVPDRLMARESSRTRAAGSRPRAAFAFARGADAAATGRGPQPHDGHQRYRAAGGRLGALPGGDQG